MIAALDVVGNPSSVHGEGRRARAVIEEARAEVARLVGARPSEIVFTSGASEANATVLAAGFEAIVASDVEHPSATAPTSGRRISLACDGDGRVTTATVADLVLKAGGIDPARSLVTLQVANGETGVLQPVDELAAFCRDHGVHFHTDATQAAGRLPVDFHGMGAATMAVSAHKLGGPKGVGALVVRDGIHLKPLIGGGGQERRRRAGTESLPAIAGFGAAARAASAELEQGAENRIRSTRDAIEAELRAITPELTVIGAGSPRLPNTTCVSVAGDRAETLVIRLDLAGVAVSAGSACSSGKVGASAVLAAMGLAPEVVAGAIRISIGPITSDRDVDALLRAWRSIHGADSDIRRTDRDRATHTAARPVAIGEM
jgi:cysteine desulfurase